MMHTAELTQVKHALGYQPRNRDFAKGGDRMRLFHKPQSNFCNLKKKAILAPFG